MLRKEIENAAVSLTASPTNGAVDKLGILVKLGTSIGDIKSINNEVLQRELGVLSFEIQSAINFEAGLVADSIGNGKDVDIAGIFNKSKEVNLNQEERQSAILDFIRQSTSGLDGVPNVCRMRDLTAKFPSVSERTLRNDLQVLVTGGFIERVGIQGPTSSFRPVTKKEIIAL